MAEEPSGSVADMQAILAQVDHAAENHERWLEATLRSIACRLPPDPRDLAEDAHRRCAFGYWYDNLAPAALRQSGGFPALGEAHRQMHAAARAMLQFHDAGDQVPAARFDEFTGALRRFRLQLAGLRHEFELATSSLDPLTGAGNRVAMLPFLRQQHALVRRGVMQCAVAMMDLDRFKSVNDVHGHAAGDRVLAAFAAYVLKHLRPYDRLFRYGGEEFLLCALDADAKSAFELAERLRKGVAATEIDAGVGKPLRIAVSIGVAALDADGTVEQAIERADAAMYQAKQAGRDRTVLWAGEPPRTGATA
jgi:diguanylate cyclase (GGDEF)-like protein